MGATRFDPGQDKFMQRFDENGNFVNLPKPEIEEDIIQENKSYFTSNDNINYHFVEKEKWLLS